MESFASKLPSDSVDANFMKAVLAVHAENYADSEKFIVQTRKQLDKSMTSLLAESYSRSYVPFVMLQQCSELEEIIEFKIMSKQHQLMQKQSNSSTPVGTTRNTYSMPSASTGMTVMYSPSDIYSTAGLFKGVIMSGVSEMNTKTSATSKGNNNLPAKQIVSTHQLVEKKVFLTHKWRERIRGCCSSGAISNVAQLIQFIR